MADLSNIIEKFEAELARPETHFASFTVQVDKGDGSLMVSTAFKKFGEGVLDISQESAARKIPDRDILVQALTQVFKQIIGGGDIDPALQEFMDNVEAKK